MSNFIGVDIGNTKMLLLANNKDEFIEKKVLTGKNIKLEDIKKEIQNFISELPFNVDGIGIGLPGLVKDESKVIVSDLQVLNGVEADYFSYHGCNVKFMNDVKAATLGESSFYQGKDTLALIMAGTGLALGVYSDHKILKGASGFSGELGYTYFPTEDGLKTIDDLCGGAGILNQAQCDIDEFLNRLDQGDKEACNIIKKAGNYLGLCIIQVLHLYNPDVFIIGGSTSTYNGYYDAALKVAKEYAIKEIFDACEFKRPRDMKRVVALGALELMNYK